MVDAAHRVGRGRDRRRDPAAARAGRPVRGHRDRPATGRRIVGVPREAQGRGGAGRRPRRRSTPRWATTCSRPQALLDALRRRRARPDQQARHGRQHHPDARRSAARRDVYDFARQRRAGLHRARPRLLARRRDARRLLRGPHGPDLGAPGLQPLQRRVADLHRPRPAAAGQVRAQRRRPGRPGDRLARVHRRRSSPAARRRALDPVAGRRAALPVAGRRTRC